MLVETSIGFQKCPILCYSFVVKQNCHTERGSGQIHTYLQEHADTLCINVTQ